MRKARPLVLWFCLAVCAGAQNVRDVQKSEELYSPLPPPPSGPVARTNATGALQISAALGGFEIAAMTGAILEATTQNTPVVLDGYIASAAALLAFLQNEEVRRILIPATCSAEPGHIEILRHLQLDDKPMFNWGLRLGEGSAATLFLPIVKSACAICSEMATLASVLNGAK